MIFEFLLFQGHLPTTLVGLNKNTRVVGDIVADIGGKESI